MSLQVMSTESEAFSARVVIPLPRGRRPMVDVVVAVRNQEPHLRAAILRLHQYLAHEFPFTARITIADAASTDATPAVAAALAAELPDVRVLRLNDSGRGRALAAAWLTSEARVVASMDAGPASDLSILQALVAPIIFGHSQVAVASRAGRMQSRFRGLQVIRADVVRRLVPQVVNRGWFFETEVLVRARRAGLRITG